MRRLALAALLIMAPACSGSSDGVDAASSGDPDAQVALDASFAVDASSPDGGQIPACTAEGAACSPALACCAPTSCGSKNLCCRLSGVECTDDAQCCSNHCKPSTGSSTGLRCVVYA